MVMGVSGCTSGIARSRRKHGAAQAVRAKDGQPAASLQARTALDGKSAVIR